MAPDLLETVMDFLRYLEKNGPRNLREVYPHVYKKSIRHDGKLLNLYIRKGNPELVVSRLVWVKT